MSQFLISTHCRSPIPCYHNIVLRCSFIKVKFNWASYNFAWPQLDTFLRECLQVCNSFPIFAMQIFHISVYSKDRLDSTFQRLLHEIPVTSWLYLGLQRRYQSFSSSHAHHSSPVPFLDALAGSIRQHLPLFRWLLNELSKFYSYHSILPLATKAIPVSQFLSALD